MATIIDSPKGLTDYFASKSCQNHAWLVFNGDKVVGWHASEKEAQNELKCFYWLSVVKVYNSLGR